MVASEWPDRVLQYYLCCSFCVGDSGLRAPIFSEFSLETSQILVLVLIYDWIFYSNTRFFGNLSLLVCGH
jgi:hypothetical protein